MLCRFIDSSLMAKLQAERPSGCIVVDLLLNFLFSFQLLILNKSLSSVAENEKCYFLLFGEVEKNSREMIYDG